MSLPRDELPPVPVETARVARTAFPDGNVYLRLRDELGTLFDDELFTAVYSVEGQPALHPWQLALVSVMQFMENEGVSQLTVTTVSASLWPLEAAPLPAPSPELSPVRASVLLSDGMAFLLIPVSSRTSATIVALIGVRQGYQ